MLEPEGFHGALWAYGLPDTLIKFNISSQADVPYMVKTAYGLTDSLVSKIHPCLSFQLISHSHVVELDHLLAKKVHDFFGFPFPFHSQLPSLPIVLLGADFLSITSINAEVTVGGIIHDLDHHVLMFRCMAQITMADWACTYNSCTFPFEASSLARSFRPSFHGKLPHTWLLAHDVLRSLNVSIRSTDQSNVSLGQLSLTHICSSLRDYPNGIGIISFEQAERDVLSLLRNLFDRISVPHIPSQLTASSILQPRSIILAAIHASHSYALSLPSFSLFLILAALLYRADPQSDIFSPFTDHLNAVHFLHNALRLPPALHVWSSLPARPLYCWLYNILQSFPSTSALQYLHAHTNHHDIASWANDAVDIHATRSQTVDPHPAFVPLPTFTMDDCILFRDDTGFLESSIGPFIRSLLHHQLRSSTDFVPAGFMNWSLYDHHSPPLHPYTRTSYAYSAVVQMYARSQQLATKHTLFLRLGNISPRCRFGCGVVETAHHLFVSCQTFTSLRTSYISHALTALQDLIDRSDDQINHSFHVFSLRHTAEVLFTDDVARPLAESRYYFGLLPRLDTLISQLTAWSPHAFGVIVSGILPFTMACGPGPIILVFLCLPI
ncbi:hypothetical protein DFS33DRAFT_1484845 [Desarmillaria ectypa]|nr:hypothetical protein DFS33DRAFT_1484845 [Desarmillaria ectypa]